MLRVTPMNPSTTSKTLSIRDLLPNKNRRETLGNLRPHEHSTRPSYLRTRTWVTPTFESPTWSQPDYTPLFSCTLLVSAHLRSCVIRCQTSWIFSFWKPQRQLNIRVTSLSQMCSSGSNRTTSFADSFFNVLVIRTKSSKHFSTIGDTTKSTLCAFRSWPSSCAAKSRTGQHLLAARITRPSIQKATRYQRTCIKVTEKILFEISSTLYQHDKLCLSGLCRVPSTNHRDDKHIFQSKTTRLRKILPMQIGKYEGTNTSKLWTHDKVKSRSIARSPRNIFSKMPYLRTWVHDAPRIDGTRDVWKHIDSECRIAIFVQSVQELVILMSHVRFQQSTCVQSEKTRPLKIRSLCVRRLTDLSRPGVLHDVHIIHDTTDADHFHDVTANCCSGNFTIFTSNGTFPITHCKKTFGASTSMFESPSLQSKTIRFQLFHNPSAPNDKTKDPTESDGSCLHVEG